MDGQSLVSLLVGVVMLGGTSLLHYGGLALISRIPIRRVAKHYLSLLIVPALGLLHLVEIVLWALVYFCLHQLWGLGDFVDMREQSPSNYFYHSISSYSTLGLADFKPDDPFKILTGVQALTGFMMITWSASFLYAAFSGFWQQNREEK